MDILNRPAIKAEARNFISVNNRWFYMFIAGIVPAIYSLIFSAHEGYISKMGYSTFQMILMSDFGIFPLLSPIIFILITPIIVSLFGYYLKCIRYAEFTSGSVYKNASLNYGKFLLTYLLKLIFTILWSFLLVVPGIIKGLAYSMTEFIINDNPNLDPTEAIRISEKITDGFKSDIFVLYLSFILWYLLCGITCGIGYIYVFPYINTTLAMYYENLKKYAIDNNIASVRDFGIN